MIFNFENESKCIQSNDNSFSYNSNDILQFVFFFFFFFTIFLKDYSFSNIYSNSFINLIDENFLPIFNRTQIINDFDLFDKTFIDVNLDSLLKKNYISLSNENEIEKVKIF